MCRGLAHCNFLWATGSRQRGNVFGVISGEQSVSSLLCPRSHNYIFGTAGDGGHLLETLRLLFFYPLVLAGGTGPCRGISGEPEEREIIGLALNFSNCNLTFRFATQILIFPEFSLLCPWSLCFVWNIKQGGFPVRTKKRDLPSL